MRIRTGLYFWWDFLGSEITMLKSHILGKRGSMYLKSGQVLFLFSMGGQKEALQMTNLRHLKKREEWEFPKYAHKRKDTI